MGLAFEECTTTSKKFESLYNDKLKNAGKDKFNGIYTNIGLVIPIIGVRDTQFYYGNDSYIFFKDGTVFNYSGSVFKNNLKSFSEVLPIMEKNRFNQKWWGFFDKADEKLTAYFFRDVYQGGKKIIESRMFEIRNDSTLEYIPENIPYGREYKNVKQVNRQQVLQQPINDTDYGFLFHRIKIDAKIDSTNCWMRKK